MELDCTGVVGGNQIPEREAHELEANRSSSAEVARKPGQVSRKISLFRVGPLQPNE